MVEREHESEREREHAFLTCSGGGCGDVRIYRNVTRPTIEVRIEPNLEEEQQIYANFNLQDT